MGPRRGEIYFVDLGPIRGREQAYRRPVVVLSIDALNRQPLVVSVVPGTKAENVSRNHLSDVRVPPAASGLPKKRSSAAFNSRQSTFENFHRNLPAGSRVYI